MGGEVAESRASTYGIWLIGTVRRPTPYPGQSKEYGENATRMAFLTPSTARSFDRLSKTCCASNSLNRFRIGRFLAMWYICRAPS